MREPLYMVRLASRWDMHVLLSGESGSGKNVLARAIHDLSKRRAYPFLDLNCAAFHEGLIESELFGHVKGAYTGATRDRAGAFEFVGDGTLVLDEIGELPLHLQAKLLKVLDTGEFSRVGEHKIRKARCRVIAATNRDLPRDIRKKRFRKDLYYRLRRLCIHVPPLRERREDITHLVLNRLRQSPTPKTIDEGSLALLVAHVWDGNVRELVSCIDEAIARSNGNPIIQKEHVKLLEPIQTSTRQPAWRQHTIEEYGKILNLHPDFWEPFLNWALDKLHWNVSRLCRKLCISKPTFYKLAKSLNLQRPPQDLDAR